MLTKAFKFGSTVLLACLLGGVEAKGVDANFEELAVQARRDLGTSEGPAYHSAVARTYMHKLAGSIGFCMRRVSDSSAEPFQAVLVVMADGKVSQVAVNPRTDVSKCIQERLLRTRFSKPPFAPFHDLMAVNFKQE